SQTDRRVADRNSSTDRGGSRAVTRLGLPSNPAPPKQRRYKASLADTALRGVLAAIFSYTLRLTKEPRSFPTFVSGPGGRSSGADWPVGDSRSPFRSSRRASAPSRRALSGR